MTNELVKASIGTITDNVVSKKQAAVSDGSLVLTGPYTWQAAFAHLVHEHLNKEGGKEWCTLECFARFIERRATNAARTRARNRIASLASELLNYGEFLLIDYSGPCGAKSAMRLFRTSDDPEMARAQITAALKRGETTLARAQAAEEIICYKHTRTAS